MLKKLPYLIAVILICIAPMADGYVLIPAMTGLSKALPEVSPAQLNLIMTISSLFVIPSSLIAGKLVVWGKISKKNCLLLGFSVYTLGGAAGGLLVDFHYILFTRAILGIGSGLATAMVVTITVDYFTEKEGAKVMGLYSAVGGLLAIILTVLSGYLVLIHWRLAFSVYLVCILVIVYHAIVLRNKNGGLGYESREYSKSQAAETIAAHRVKTALGRAVWVLVAIVIMSQTIGFTLYLSLSHFIEGEALGDASSTGIANGALTVSIVLISLSFSRIYSKLGKHSMLLIFILMAMGFFFLSKSHSFAMALAALIIWGAGFGLSIPYIMQEAIACSPPPLITFVGSLVNSCIFLSYALSAFLQPLISQISGNDSIRFYYTVASTLLVVGGMLSLILIQAGKKKL